MPTTPLIAATFAASRVTCFGPEQDCARLATTVTTIRREFLATLDGAAGSSRTRLIGGRGAFSPTELAGDLLEDSGAVALASSLAAEFAIAANFVALHRLTSGFP
jgi:hypothetical protein